MTTPNTQPAGKTGTKANAAAGKSARPRNNSKANGGQKGRVSNKRRNSFWDPLYSPQFRGTDSDFDWDTTNISGIKYSECTADALAETMRDKTRTRWAVKGFAFENCDFRGNFVSMGLSFNECRFSACDLGGSTWKDVKFSKCVFSRSSFSLATFDQCQFIDCTWEDIGISGTESKFFNTIITNPWDFIMAACTNTDRGVLEQRGNTTPAYQTMRLEETKVKIARVILSNSEGNGDDSVYYNAVKTYLTQSLISRRTRAMYEMQTNRSLPRRISSAGSFLLAAIELSILRLSGAINAWGFSLARPALVGLAIILLFAAIYRLTGITCDSSDVVMACTNKLALMTSFDVSLLVGYTKHAGEKTTWLAQLVYGCNALIGLWWYAVFVPTVINRISRVR
ncbi:pentapeptide repeat-containing protein [Burkholderia diffusa]|uniref:Pentapeptide repeat-containing protein n=1 Tax=Burkholderia diffusa TaxID=488732 RepID=A0A6P2LU19_9BURK|nr:pentapeptide repeat-containing protein [Burkholderia diffusa]KAB0657132.1 hypothetical protein F7R23_12095 [Burkholderia diffusa]MBM2655021.1 pentapeptide repeat-containing protein [Burkholderia diffusa]VWB75689.1 hypothetical protein BDI24065_03598 [Burkholderia diffusa]